MYYSIWFLYSEFFFNNFRERGQVGQVGQGGQVGVLQLGSPLILDGRKCIEISDR